MTDPAPEARPHEKHRVVIVGGGFGGLNAARVFRHSEAAVTLVDRRNYHLFQPLLYQVATGGLSPANIATPMRGVVRHQKNTEVVLGEVVGFDLDNQIVHLADGALPFDSLIVATGSTHSYFGHEEWSEIAPGLKSIENATQIRRRILFAFEHAEREADPETKRAWMTFVIVGGGPTGVELAGSIAELARHTLRDDFRHIDPAQSHIVLADGEPCILSAYPHKLSQRAQRDLQTLGVDVRNETHVTDVAEGWVTLTDAQTGQKSDLPTWTVLWAAGVQASPLAKELAESSGAQIDRAGRVEVNPDCSLAGYPNVFAIGDMAQHLDGDGKPLPGLAQVAIQQGKYVADLIDSRIHHQPPPKPFSYRDLGMMSTIGRNRAVAKIGNWTFQGWIAWMMWIFVHVMQLVQFQNRILVFAQWVWHYGAFSRSARLITGKVLPLKVLVPHIGLNGSIGNPDSAAFDHEQGNGKQEKQNETPSATPTTRPATVEADQGET